MDRVKGFMSRAIYSGGRKPGEDRQPRGIQQTGGDHGQQQQSPPLERDSGKGFFKARRKLGSLSPFPNTTRSTHGTTLTSHARSPAQSNTVAVANNTLAPASGKTSNSLFPPGRDPELSTGESLASSATPAHAPIGVGLGDGIVQAVHFSPPQETTPGGKLEDSPTAIPISDLQDSVATTIRVSAPSSDSQTSSTNCISDTKNGPTVCPSISAHLWQKALEIAQESLVKYKLPPLEIDFQSQSAEENIQSLLAELEGAQQENKNRQWRYQDRQGNEVAWVERLGKILKSVDKYAKIVDIAIQNHPDVTSLVWAGARTILQVALNHVEAMECFEEAMVTIMDKMVVSAFYAGIYTGSWLQTAMGDTGKLCKVLNMALPEFYAAVIVFAIKAHQYFEARWVKKAINMLKPFAIEFQPFIDDITRKEKTIQGCANMATMERIRRSSDKIVEMENFVIESKEILKCSLDEQLLELLSPLEPLKRHADIRSIRLENTGTWLLELECFRKWCDIESTNGNERILCCYGMPGAGKTLISSLVIDYLCSQVTKRTTSRTSVICLYADYRDQDNQTLVHILGSFLHQFLTSASLLHIPDQVIKTLKEIKKRKTKIDLQNILAMLELILEQLDGSFFCIDALDELELQTRRDLLDIMSKKLQLEPRVHQGKEVEIIANENDIRQYLHHKIAKDRHANPDAINEVLENEILSILIGRSQGMFLLPALHIAMVLEQATISKRRKALRTLPTELNDTFAGVIKRIQQSRGHAELGMKVLLWLHLAYRPLKLKELQHALAVEKDDSYFEVDNIPSQKTILDCCLGLVQIDEETMTVRFIHYTLEEYFRLQSSVHFPRGYSDVAETCLIYLNFPEIREHCKYGHELTNKVNDFPFLVYAACNWGTYAKLQSNDAVIKLAITLSGSGNKLPSTPLQLLYASITGQWDFKCRRRVALLFSGIHVGASFALDELTKCYCEMEQADAHDDTGRSPLSWAAGRGHESVARLLLERNDVDVNAKDKLYCRSPLSWAAKNGHEAVVRLLLEQNDVDVDARDRWSLPPLSCAAEGGHVAIVRLLLERNDVDVNAKDNRYGQTPLSLAAKNGREAVVRLLLERNDVDVDAKDNSSRSPLSWAAANGHEAIVRLLLERNDVDVDAKDNIGRSPLSWGAANGSEAVVRLLLEQNHVDVNAKDNRYGQTPLTWATENGRAAVVRLLLERNDVDVNAKDKHGLSPLACAAGCGHEAIVQLLLERNHVDVNAKDKYGRSPLPWAAACGHEAVVRLLLERNHVDVDAKDEKYGQTPLSWAAQNGHEAVVRLLLERNGVDVNAKDKHGRSPLSWAAGCGHEAVVWLLLERNHVDVNAKDEKYGRTPLSWAAANGHQAVVRLLLERNDVDVDAKDNSGWSPLSLAAMSGYEAVVRLLVEQDNINLDAKDSEGRAALDLATLNGNTSIAELIQAAAAHHEHLDAHCS